MTPPPVREALGGKRRGLGPTTPRGAHPPPAPPPIAASALKPPAQLAPALQASTNRFATLPFSHRRRGGPREGKWRPRARRPASVPTSGLRKRPPPAAVRRGDSPALAPAARRHPRAAHEDPDGGGAGGRAAATRGKAARAPGGRGRGGLGSSARTHWRNLLTDVCVALLPQPSWAGPTPLEAASGPAPHWAAFVGGAGGIRPEPAHFAAPRFLLDGWESGGAESCPSLVKDQCYHVAFEIAPGCGAPRSGFRTLYHKIHKGLSRSPSPPPRLPLRT